MRKIQLSEHSDKEVDKTPLIKHTTTVLAKFTHLVEINCYVMLALLGNGRNTISQLERPAAALTHHKSLLLVIPN